MSESNDQKQVSSKRDFLFQMYSVTADWVKFCDAKAGAIIALYALLFGLVISNLYEIKQALLWVSSGWTIFLLTGLIVSSGASVLFAMLSVAPRLDVGAPSSLTYFADIARFASGEKKENMSDKKRCAEYVAALLMRNAADDIQDLASQIWANACVAWRKYRLMAWAFRSFYVSLVFFFIGLSLLLVGGFNDSRTIPSTYEQGHTADTLSTAYSETFRECTEPTEVGDSGVGKSR